MDGSSGMGRRWEERVGWVEEGVAEGRGSWSWCVREDVVLLLLCCSCEGGG